MLRTVWCIFLLNKWGIKTPLFKNLRKRYLFPIRIKLGRKTGAIMISSYNRYNKDIVFLEHIRFGDVGSYFMKQSMVDIIIDFLITIYRYTIKDIRRLMVVINLEDEITSPIIMDILEMKGFTQDPSMTMSILEFNKPWRERENLKFIVYTRPL